MIAKTPEDCEWYTPPNLLEQIYQVMEIDLDPASPVVPNVKAKNHYTKKENGLLHPWTGNIFLNPPYGREIIPWIHKLCNEWSDSHVKNAICLVPAKTDTKWFNILAERSVCFCTIRGRIKFVRTECGACKKTGTFSSVLVLLSSDEEIIEKFIDTFSPLGYCWRHIES